MLSPQDGLWGSLGSLGMQGCEEMRLLTGSRGTAPPPLMWGRSRPWESLGEIFNTEFIAGWRTNTGYGGRTRAIPNGKLGS